MRYRRRTRPTRRGLTLVESVAAIVIVSVMLVAALNTLAGAVKARSIRADAGQIHLLAHDLMSEILTCFYEEPRTKVDQGLVTFAQATVTSLQPDTGRTPGFGPEAGEADGTRMNFDDVDDYHGWNGGPNMLAKDGTVLTGVDGYTRQVAVAYVTPVDPSIKSAIDTGLKRIIVTVTGPDQRKVTVRALRSKVSAFDQPPGVTASYVNWVGLELQPTGGDKNLYSGAMSVNLTP